MQRQIKPSTVLESEGDSLLDILSIASGEGTWITIGRAKNERLVQIICGSSLESKVQTSHKAVLRPHMSAILLCLDLPLGVPSVAKRRSSAVCPLLINSLSEKF